MNRHTATACTIVLCALFSGSSTTLVKAESAPVYVHMNGANFFLESDISVEPGQPVIFVSQDTGGVHTIIGYDAHTGAPMPSIKGTVQKTAGPGHAVSTYTVRLKTIGVYEYYCSVHAILAKTFGGAIQPAHRPGIDGFTGAMAGTIVVTRDRALLNSNPATSMQLIVAGFFGG